MLEPRRDQPEAQRKLSVHLARGEAEIREAQRLRYRVFAEEMGARLPSAEEGIDEDLFDPWCEHLVVTDEETGEVLGTYRILSGLTAKRHGRVLLGPGVRSRPALRICANVRSSWAAPACIRTIAAARVIALLWSGLAQYMQRTGYEYILGCASMSMVDGGHAAASAYRAAAGKHMSPAEYRVFPLCPLPLHDLDQNATPIDSAADQGLPAGGRVGVRRAGLGSGLQHRRSVDDAAAVAGGQRYAKHFMRNAGSQSRRGPHAPLGTGRPLAFPRLSADPAVPPSALRLRTWRSCFLSSLASGACASSSAGRARLLHILRVRVQRARPLPAGHHRRHRRATTCPGWTSG